VCVSSPEFFSKKNTHTQQNIKKFDGVVAVIDNKGMRSKTLDKQLCRVAWNMFFICDRKWIEKQ